MEKLPLIFPGNGHRTVIYIVYICFTLKTIINVFLKAKQKSKAVIDRTNNTYSRTTGIQIALNIFSLLQRYKLMFTRRACSEEVPNKRIHKHKS